MRARILATCRDVLVHGRAVAGQVESLKIARVGGADAGDHYEFGFVDGAGQRHVLKAFWNTPPLRLEPGASVVVLHDPADPLRAAVYPLDYPVAPGCRAAAGIESRPVSLRSTKRGAAPGRM